MKYLILILLVVASVTIFAEESFSVSGVNEIEYRYREAEGDSLKHYFKDDFSFRLNYKNFTFGMAFIGGYPEYSSYEGEMVDQLEDEDIYYKWDERWIAYETEEMMVHAGTMDGSYGSGMTFRSWEDDDLDHDTRLEGAKAKYSKKFLTVQGMYAAYPIDRDGEEKNDIVSGADLEIKPIKQLRLGMTLLGLRQGHTVIDPNTNAETDKYSKLTTVGGRVNFNMDFIDFYAEYAKMKETELLVDDRDGNGLYSTVTVYVPMFTITGGYKKYEDFNYRTDSVEPLQDIPTMNHADEPLTDSGLKPGEDEEGIMGEVRFVPDYASEVVVNYAEAWSSDDDYKQANLFLQGKHEFESYTITADYEHLEYLNDVNETWEKEVTPALSFDFYIAEMPVMIRGEYEMISKKDGQIEKEHNEPLLQMDMAIGDWNLSLMAETEYEEVGDIDKAPWWVGGEVSAPITDDTRFTLFAGKQKGGKVCRNGICRQQSAFEGVLLEMTTTF